jgi:ribosomal protein S6--L-glutamate ligase
VIFGVISAYPRRDWQSRRLIAACARRGAVEVFAPTELALTERTVRARGHDARRFDVWFLARGLGRHGDPDFQCGVYRALGRLGLPVLNPVDALLAAEDKAETSFLLARAGVPTPAMRAAQDLESAERALAELGDAVAKPPYGSLGIGVERVVAGAPDSRRRLAALLRQHGVVYLQRWVGRTPPEDLRLFVAGPEIAGAIARVAPDGDFRANVHQGGQARAFRPDAALGAMAVAAARALGLEYAGVDVIVGPDGPTVIEVNGTPSWRAVHEATGLDMAEAIVAHSESFAVGKLEWRGLDAEATGPQYGQRRKQCREERPAARAE